jgi:hypothetical protein
VAKVIVAFGHQKNVGKDSIIKFCIEALRMKRRGLNLVRRGFADPMYEFLYRLYGWAGVKPRDYYQDDPRRKNEFIPHLNRTFRDCLIDFGQHVRKFDDKVWLNCNLKTKDFDVLFVSDLRFPTEFQGCKEENGVLIRLTRPGLPVPSDEADTALNGWESKWDLTVNNDGDLSRLYNLAETVVDNYILPRL